MTDEEHVNRVVNAVNAMSEAVAAAREDGLTVHLVELSIPGLPYSVHVERTTVLHPPRD